MKILSAKWCSILELKILRIQKHDECGDSCSEYDGSSNSYNSTKVSYKIEKLINYDMREQCLLQMEKYIIC